MRKRSIEDAKLVAFLLANRENVAMRDIAAREHKPFSWALREAVRHYLRTKGWSPRK